MFGQGLIKGLSITIKHFFEKNITQMYPDVKPNLPPRSHGSFKLNLNACIACGICANACPNHVIEISSEKDENNKKKLTGYKMYIERCLFCGLCVESCPPKALKTITDFENACYTRDGCNIDMIAVGFREEVPPKVKAEPKEAKTEGEAAQSTDN